MIFSYLRASKELTTKDIETLQKNSQFVNITSSGIRESHPHNINITKENINTAFFDMNGQISIMFMATFLLSTIL